MPTSHLSEHRLQQDNSSGLETLSASIPSSLPCNTVHYKGKDRADPSVDTCVPAAALQRLQSSTRHPRMDITESNFYPLSESTNLCPVPPVRSSSLYPQSDIVVTQHGSPSHVPVIDTIKARSSHVHFRSASSFSVFKRKTSTTDSTASLNESNPAFKSCQELSANTYHSATSTTVTMSESTTLSNYHGSASTSSLPSYSSYDKRSKYHIFKSWRFSKRRTITIDYKHDDDVIFIPDLPPSTKLHHPNPLTTPSLRGKPKKSLLEILFPSFTWKAISRRAARSVAAVQEPVALEGDMNNSGDSDTAVAEGGNVRPNDAAMAVPHSNDTTPLALIGAQQWHVDGHGSSSCVTSHDGHTSIIRPCCSQESLKEARFLMEPLPHDTPLNSYEAAAAPGLEQGYQFCQPSSPSTSENASFGTRPSTPDDELLYHLRVLRGHHSIIASNGTVAITKDIADDAPSNGEVASFEDGI
ncbi:hypothetical protein BGW42_005029 [Actinomortierella wolfii]|nr:hypothetical protein BGW42_005029 [Actinomortierella wolfii]